MKRSEMTPSIAILLLGVLGAGSLASLEVHAAAWCTLRGVQVQSSNGGALILHGDASSDGGAKSYVYLCSTVDPANNVLPGACKDWMAIALVAQVTGRSLTVYTTGNDCGPTNFPAWGWVPGASYLSAGP